MATVLNNEHTPNPVAGSGVESNEAVVSANDTSFMQVRRMEEVLLRGLFCYPATSILATVEHLEQEDFLGAAQGWVMRGIRQAAREMIAAGEGDRKVYPEVVAVALQDTGKLSHGETSMVLLRAVTGHLPAWQDMQQLASALRINRLRRVMDDLGHCLIAATHGPVDVLTSTLNRIPQLEPLAHRAGLEVG